MRTKKLIKRFVFSEDNRTRVVLGASARLNPATHRLQLKADADGEYPTDANITAKTWVAFPANAKGWLGFEVVAKNIRQHGVQITSLGFRLGDGTNEYRWDGAAWVVNTTLWNTEAEVANNISAFPIAAQKIQVIINLATTSGAYTPEVEMVKVLYKSDIEFQDDLISRSLIPLLKSFIRPIADFPFEVAATSTKFDLASVYIVETPYNIVGIDSVYNHTDDPKHLTDLLSSYNATTKVVTLSSSVSAGKTLWVRFYYEPVVALKTSQDYHEVDKVPAIHLSDVTLSNSSELPQDDTVSNKETGLGTRVKAPVKSNVNITLQFLTDKSRDHQVLADELKRFFGENQMLTSKGLDEQYRLQLLDEYTDMSSSSQKELHTGRLRFRICDALFFNKAAVDVYLVKEFHATGGVNFVTKVN